MPSSSPGPVTLQKYGAALGRSAPTLWRYRRKGWLRTINIAGRPYVLPADALEFERRAAGGEFAQEPHGAARGTRSHTSSAALTK